MDKVFQSIYFGQLQYTIHLQLLVYLGKIFGTTDPTTKNLVSYCACDLYDTDNYAVAYIDHFINQTYNPSNKFNKNPAAYVVQSSMEMFSGLCGVKFHEGVVRILWCVSWRRRGI